MKKFFKERKVRKTMPDITMCPKSDLPTKEENKCPQKYKCCRFMSIPDRHWQSYFAEIPYDRETLECKEFMPMRGDEC